jgi:hypothetical protein
MVATAPVTVNGEYFADTMKSYIGAEKLIDALIKADNPESAFSDAIDTIERMRSIVAHGTRYTPPSELGLGSDNSASICAKLLGESKSVSVLRKLLRDKFKASK